MSNYSPHLCLPVRLSRRLVGPLHRQSLFQLMNGPIRKKLGVIPQNVTWGGMNLTISHFFIQLSLFFLHDFSIFLLITF